MPRSQNVNKGDNRALDCAVIKYINQSRKENDQRTGRIAKQDRRENLREISNHNKRWRLYRAKLANGAKQRREARQAKSAFRRFCLKTALKIEIASKQFCRPIARILDILNLHLSYLIIKIRCVFIKIRPFEIDPSKSDQVKVGLHHFDFLSHFKVFGESIGIHVN